jgi:ABC-type bacteriocin/lantibiotic exporter with double-glycine peptidase domain
LPIIAELDNLGDHLREAPRARHLYAGGRAPAGGTCSISFEAVSFTHCTGEGEPQGGVRSIELIVAPGEFVGLSGFTGSGKSTLLDLIAGLEKPDAGKVLFGGRELSEAGLAAHRARLAYLAADPLLFGGTVRSNLAWTAPEAGDEAMWDALEAATATDLVRRLGGGLDSRIHEAGANLSAGERQQIAIARAMLRRPSLLLLDEATSSLDRDRERRVLANLASRDPRPTIVFVSHREESFAQFDRVVALSDGQIVSIRRVT